MANCKYCGKEIVWMQDGRKKVPVEVDGAKHECDAYIKSRDSLKTIDPASLDPETVQQYLANIKKKKK
jgi:hypothetical protein